MSMIPNVLKSRVLQDIASGLTARIVAGIAAIIAVPVLVHTLGPERYAAIGLFLTVQMLGGLLDIGFSTGLGRQAAWLTGINAGREKFATLLRSFEIPYLAIAAAITILGTIFGQAFLIAVFKFDPQTLGLDHLGVILIFAAVGIRFPFNLYINYLSGRGKIQRANLILLATELLRIIGAVILVVWFGPYLSIFFGWQVFVATTAVAILYVASWRITPTDTARIVPEWRNLHEIRGLMWGASNMIVLFIAANAIDKLLLPRFIGAAEYGLYVATGQLALSVFLIVQAVWAALNPRLLASIAAKDAKATRGVFLIATGLMTALFCGFMIATMIATPSVLRIWIGSAASHYDASASRFDIVLVALCAGFGMAGLSYLALTIHQAASRYFPTPLIFSAAIIGVPL
ncbi:MAG: hypothetical protein ABI830_04640, partial [Pseudolabrys sp.]